MLSGVALTFALINCAQATPVDWTADLSLNYIGVNNSLTSNFVTGSFTYDADTGTLSNVNLSYKLAEVTGSTTTVASSSLAAFNGKVFVDTNTLYLAPGRAKLSFQFSDFFSNAGGVLNAKGVYLFGQPATTSYSDFSGTLTGVPQATAVPEPEAYAMMLAGLGLVGFAARRKQKTA